MGTGKITWIISAISLKSFILGVLNEVKDRRRLNTVAF